MHCSSTLLFYDILGGCALRIANFAMANKNLLFFNNQSSEGFYRLTVSIEVYNVEKAQRLRFKLSVAWV